VPFLKIHYRRLKLSLHKISSQDMISYACITFFEYHSAFQQTVYVQGMKT